MKTFIGIIVIAGLVAASLAWHTWFDRRTGGRSRSALWGAFNATAISLLCIVSGLLGYQLHHGMPFTIESAWKGRVLWNEIGIGLALAVVAAFFWRAGLRSVRAEPQRR